MKLTQRREDAKTRRRKADEAVSIRLTQPIIAGLQEKPSSPASLRLCAFALKSY
jgi:hypothetical protein